MQLVNCRQLGDNYKCQRSTIAQTINCGDKNTYFRREGGMTTAVGLQQIRILNMLNANVTKNV